MPAGNWYHDPISMKFRTSRLCHRMRSRAVNQTLTFIAWPFVRHHVFSLTASMSIPPFTLPLMRFKFTPATYMPPDSQKP